MTKISIKGKIRKAKKQNPEFKNLICAFLRIIDTDRIKDISRHSASYCFKDMTKFYKKHKRDIIKFCKKQADEHNIELIKFISTFNSLRGYNYDEIANGLYNTKSNEKIVKNSMTWFTLEEVCRMIIEIE